MPGVRTSGQVAGTGNPTCVNLHTRHVLGTCPGVPKGSFDPQNLYHVPIGMWVLYNSEQLLSSPPFRRPREEEEGCGGESPRGFCILHRAAAPTFGVFFPFQKKPPEAFYTPSGWDWRQQQHFLARHGSWKPSGFHFRGSAAAAAVPQEGGSHAAPRWGPTAEPATLPKSSSFQRLGATMPSGSG